MKRYFCYIVVLLNISQCFGVETLTVSYLERPPYYYTKNGKVAGTIIEFAQKVFDDAGIEVQYQVLPPKRVIAEIKRKGNNHCSIGWFKTKQRESFAHFSLPLFQNKPNVVLTTKRAHPKVANYKSLKELFSDRTLTMVTMASFSYGKYIDDLISEHMPNKIETYSKQNVLPKHIVSGRGTYMLTAPEEVEELIKSADLDTADFVSIPMKDIPVGNKRYIMFNTSVDPKVIEKVNRAIEKLIKLL